MFFITGSEGMIGSYIMPVIKETGEYYATYDIKNKLDIMDVDRLTNLMSSYPFKIVVHLAAYPHPGIDITDEEYMRVNVQGTKNVLYAMERSNCNKIIFMSSGGVYGFSNGTCEPKALPLTEDSPVTLKPTIYDKTKIICEEILKFNADFNSVVFRVEKPANDITNRLLKQTQMFAAVSLENMQRLFSLAVEYLLNGGKTTILNMGNKELVGNESSKVPDNIIEWAKENYPDAEINLENKNSPLYSVQKAIDVLGY